ncbi:unnamed protein product [Protopolystoma xenopodis]|uniref:Uncharacterized protein n=1 Tax=Protopolystoma xenopodis TaxID=117903 RepID=A0A448WPG0_9PLAT|nr:unnamed protein product [Protopolystoma xenopodis]
MGLHGFGHFSDAIRFFWENFFWEHASDSNATSAVSKQKSEAVKCTDLMTPPVPRNRRSRILGCHPAADSVNLTINMYFGQSAPQQRPLDAGLGPAPNPPQRRRFRRRASGRGWSDWPTERSERETHAQRGCAMPKSVKWHQLGMFAVNADAAPLLLRRGLQ